uniref:Alcohol dehydrogenase-like N-terminal domain-containing protein n=1 Tax=Glycine max TaxID=3847 RepID=K7LF00_SOYBN
MALLATASSLLHKYSLVPKRNTPRSSLLFLIEMASQAEIEHPKKAFGWAARDPSGLLSPFNFSRSETGEKDVAFKVLYCGICHSDLHMVKNEWGFSTYPLVPGHELVGVVIEVGSKVEKFKVGDKVGVGCLVDSCRTCQNCSENLENYCPQYTLTYGAKHRDGTITYGGYSDSMVAEEHFVIRIPDGLALDAAAPLLCAGITVYSPQIFCTRQAWSTCGCGWSWWTRSHGCQICQSFWC